MTDNYRIQLQRMFPDTQHWVWNKNYSKIIWVLSSPRERCVIRNLRDLTQGNVHKCCWWQNSWLKSSCCADVFPDFQVNRVSRISKHGMRITLTHLNVIFSLHAFLWTFHVQLLRSICSMEQFFVFYSFSIGYWLK